MRAATAQVTDPELYQPGCACICSPLEDVLIAATLPKTISIKGNLIKGVILAAGIGSRLRPLTAGKPKCLVKVHGKALLDFQLDAYRRAGISEIYIVAGYEAGALVEHCRHITDLQLTIVENVDFESTNNMYSLSLLREYISGSPFILNNADLAIDSDVIRRMVEDERPDLIAVDTSQFNSESMKVRVRQDHSICDISKIIDEPSSYGCSIDFYKFSGQSSELLFQYVSRTVEIDGRVNEWTEVALQQLAASGTLVMYPIDIAGLPWVEVDNYEDLALADLVFSGFDLDLTNIEVVLLDLDGTLMLGNSPIPGASEFVRRASAAGKTLYFLSNNSSRSKSQYVEKLQNAGIEATEEQIVLSTDGVVEYLKVASPRSVYVLGTEALSNSLVASGVIVRDRDVEYVVVGYDTELTYQKLARASVLINKGADILASHPDIVCPTEDGPIPDVGTLIETLRMTTGKLPLKVFGKPEPEMVAHLIRGYLPSQVLMVGDRLYTDLKLAEKVGVQSALVLTGEARRDDVESLDRLPNVVLPSVAHLLPSSDPALLGAPTGPSLNLLYEFVAE